MKLSYGILMACCLYFYVKKIPNEIKHKITWKYIEFFFQPAFVSILLKTERLQTE